MSNILAERKERLALLNKELKKLFPDVSGGTILNWSNPWELMVAVMLSAQCTDKMVNIVTEKLFKKYRTLNDYLEANFEEFAQDIRQTGFYNAKAKNILAAARVLQEEFNGVVPKTIADMIRLPGVARKTANVVLGNAYGIVEGIAVDTHVIRFCVRFDLSDHKDAVKIEKDLMELLPKSEWYEFTYRVIAYGREIAPARKYDISQDPLIQIYPKAGERFRV